MQQRAASIGANLAIDSNPGKGTEVCVKVGDESVMTINVVLADDHTIVRDGLRALLEANPEIKVVGDAGNGRQVVNLVKELQPDIVIMDISMPELNGIDATRQILEAFPQVRVIILSMLGTADHVFHALQAGVRGFLLKESAGQGGDGSGSIGICGRYVLLTTDNLHIGQRLHASTGGIAI